MQDDGHVGLVGGGAHHGGGELEAGVADGPLGDLQDDRGPLFDGRVDDALDLLHVVGVKGADGKVSFVGGAQDLLAGNEWHACSPSLC